MVMDHRPDHGYSLLQSLKFPVFSSPDPVWSQSFSGPVTGLPNTIPKSEFGSEVRMNELINFWPANGGLYILQSKIGSGKCPVSWVSTLEWITQQFQILWFLRQHRAGITAYAVAVLKAYSARTWLSDHLLVSAWDVLQSRLWSNKHFYVIIQSFVSLGALIQH